MLNKKISIILLLSIIFGVLNYTYSQNESDTVLNYTDIHGNKQGHWRQYHPNGQLRYKGFFIDDIPQGTFMHYHRNGRVMSVLNYNEDGSSSVEMFWKNGHRAAKGAYTAERERNGLWEIYYKEGSLLAVINYKNGEANGEVELFYPGTNRKLLNCSYKNARLHGEYIKYFDNGLKMEKGNYKNGNRHGYYIFYTSDGFKDMHGEYEHGRRVGKWYRYEMGEIKDTLNYINGRPDNYEEKMREWEDRREWAKDNQHLFRNPQDYFDNPYEFFRDRPDPYEKRKQHNR